MYNLHVPRQRLRERLLDLLAPGTVQWGRVLTRFEPMEDCQQPAGRSCGADEVEQRPPSRVRCWFADGAVAKKYLSEHFGVSVRGYMAEMGDLAVVNFDWAEVENNPFFCPDASLVPELERFIEQLRRDGDSIGARVNVVASGMPAGWGEPVFSRLDADIAGALMSINAVKGVEIGDGFSVISQRGSEHRDEMTSNGFVSNHAGGVLGGISSGQDLLASIALKPTSSITTPARTIDREGRDTEIVTKGRHDPCVGVRATPIAEAMVAIVLMDHALRHRGQVAL